MEIVAKEYITNHQSVKLFCFSTCMKIVQFKPPLSQEILLINKMLKKHYKSTFLNKFKILKFFLRCI